MFKPFIYPESKSTKWLMAVFLALSCFVFSLSPVPANAGQLLPAQIEQTVSSREDRDSIPVSYQKIVVSLYPFHLISRSREYEKNVVFAYQKEMKVHFESISATFYSRLLPDRFLPLKIISDDSDKGFPPLSLA